MVEKNEKFSLIYENPFNIFPKYGEDVEEICQCYLADGEVISGFECLKLLEELILDDEIGFKNKDESISEIEYYQSKKSIQLLLKDDSMIFKCLDTYKHINKREPDRSSSGIDTWFEYEEKLNSITICGRTVMKTKLIDVIAMFYEVDILEKSVEQFEFMKTLKKLNFSRWLTHCGLKMPITFSNRDMVVIGVSLFEKKDKLFVISFRSATKDEYDEVPSEIDKHCRITMNTGFYIGKYVDDDHVELFISFNVDPKVAVPWFLINTFTKDIGYYMMSDFRKMIEKNSEEEIYKERILKNKKDYDIIRKAIGMKL